MTTKQSKQFQSLPGTSWFRNIFGRFSILCYFLKLFGFCTVEPNWKISGIIYNIVHDYTFVVAYNCIKYAYTGFKYAVQLFVNAFDNKIAYFLMNGSESFWTISGFNWFSNIFRGSALLISLLEIIRKLFQICNNYPNESYVLVKAISFGAKYLYRSIAFIVSSLLYCFNVVHYTIKNGDRIDRMLNRHKKNDCLKSNIFPYLINI